MIDGLRRIFARVSLKQQPPRSPWISVACRLDRLLWRRAIRLSTLVGALTAGMPQAGSPLRAADPSPGAADPNTSTAQQESTKATPPGPAQSKPRQPDAETTGGKNPGESSQAAADADAISVTAEKLRRATKALDAAKTIDAYEATLSKFVPEWLAEQDFKTIDALADQLRTSQSRLPHGALKITQLHLLLRAKAKSEAEFQARIALYEEWVRHAPTSITARLALASSWQAFGRFARGDGYASEVTREGAELYFARATKASEIIAQAKHLTDQDPELYAISIWLALDLGWSPQRVAQICRDSIALDPMFLRTLIEAVYYYYPRWYGAPGDLEQYALDAVKLTEKHWGKTVYARIVVATEMDHGYNVFNQFNFSWPITKQGFLDWNERFPPDQWRMELFCRQACLARNREDAHAMFEKIGPKGLGKVWLSDDMYKHYKRWAEPDFVSGDQDEIIEKIAMPVWGLAWTNDPEWLVAAEGYSYVSRINIKTRERSQLGETWAGNMGVAHDAKSGETFVATLVGDVHRFGSAGGAQSHFSKQGNGYTFLSLAHVGQTLVSSGVDPQVRLWNARDGELKATLKTDGGAVPAIDVATTGVLAAGLDNGKAQLWSLGDRMPLATWQAHPVCVDAVAFSPDATQLVTACGKEVKLWRRESQELVATLESPPDVSYLQFTPDGKLLVAGTQAADVHVPGLVLVWDMQTRKLIKKLKGHKAAVRAVTISPDGKTVATSSFDSSIRLWQLRE